jgi:hypothetical protein
MNYRMRPGCLSDSGRKRAKPRNKEAGKTEEGSGERGQKANDFVS